MLRLRAKLTVREDSGFTIYDLVYGHDGALITQAGVSTIVYSIINTETGTAVSGHDAQSLTVSAIIFDAAQVGNAAFNRAVDDDASLSPALRTAIKAAGYNYRHQVAATGGPTGGKVNAYDAKITPATGAAFFVSADLTVSPVWSS